jgi:hypothetical protein
MSEQPASSSGLKPVLGFPSLFVVALGVGTAQSCILSTLQGAGEGGLIIINLKKKK